MDILIFTYPINTCKRKYFKIRVLPYNHASLSKMYYFLKFNSQVHFHHLRSRQYLTHTHTHIHITATTTKTFKFFFLWAYLEYESIFELIAYGTYLGYVCTTEHMQVYAPYWSNANFDGIDLTGISKITHWVNPLPKTFPDQTFLGIIQTDLNRPPECLLTI